MSIDDAKTATIVVQVDIDGEQIVETAYEIKSLDVWCSIASDLHAIADEIDHGVSR